MVRRNVGSAKTEWLQLLEAQARAHDSAVVYPDTSEYDFLLVRGRDHDGGLLQTIANIAHDSAAVPDDAFALGVVRVSEAAHRKALVETPGPPARPYFFFDIHGPLVLRQKYAALQVDLVILDVYGETGFDPERDHMVVLPDDVLGFESKKRGP